MLLPVGPRADDPRSQVTLPRRRTAARQHTVGLPALPWPPRGVARLTFHFTGRSYYVTSPWRSPRTSGDFGVAQTSWLRLLSATRHATLRTFAQGCASHLSRRCPASVQRPPPRIAPSSHRRARWPRRPASGQGLRPHLGDHRPTDRTARRLTRSGVGLRTHPANARTASYPKE